MKVKEDIFPELKGAKGLQDYLQRLAGMTLEAFAGKFSSKEEVIQLINNLKPDVARLFLDISEYYYNMKVYYCPNCFPPKKLDKCPFCGNPFEMPAHIVLIMVISIMEKLSRGLYDYVEFFDWVGQKAIKSSYQSKLQLGEIKNVGELIDNLKDDWRKDFGSGTKITDFFKEFLTKEEKIVFVKSIKFMTTVPELPPEGERFKIRIELNYNDWIQEFGKEIRKDKLDSIENIQKYVADNNFKMIEEAVPVCFDKRDYWNCYRWDSSGTGVGFCHHKYNCKLECDKSSFLDECFDETIQVIYSWRNQFVHDAKIPAFRETAICGGTYTKNKKSGERRIVVLLTTQELKPVFETMVIKYFKKFQINCS